MLIIEEKDLEKLLEKKYQEGVCEGVKLMKERMLLACENGNPIEINNRGYWIKSDIDNLRDIFADLEVDKE